MDMTITGQIEKGTAILLNGGLVAYPTDTVYGLGASVYDDAAIERIYRVKNRPLNNPLPLLLGNISWLDTYARDISPVARELAAAFFPGAVTLVLHRSDKISDTVSGGRDTIALRVPGHKVTLALLEKTGCPIIGTSANLSGQPSALTADEVRSQIGDEIDYLIDGGRCPGGVESTIIDVTVDIPVILRLGAISIQDIEKVCKVKTV